MSALSLLGLSAIRAEIYLAIVALFLLLFGAYKQPRATQPFVLLCALALVFVGYLAFDGGSAPRSIFGGMFVSNAYTLWTKLLILASSVMALLLANDWLTEGEGKPFEYLILVMLATLGMMLMVSSGSLLAMYMSLELMSLSLYVLASFARDDTRSSEAGLKYFVLGALASGMILFGSSLVYGFAGSIDFETLHALFAQGEEVSRAALVGLVLIMVGFCFKLSVVPFHMWTPDVYEGAPTPVTAFFATAPKVAAMALFIRLLSGPFEALLSDWQQVLVVASVLSLLVGALGAIMQTNIKRLLAYSSIGHVGFMLMAVSAGSVSGMQAVLVYLTVYIFMSAGMFGCVLLMNRKGGQIETIASLAGLSKTKPLMAACVAAFMFSMAGIPPLSGFFGKMVVVIALVQSGMVWLAVVGVATSVIGCYYYLKVVKIMYFDEPAAAFDSKPSCVLLAVTSMGVVVTSLFFLLPSPVLQQAQFAAEALLP